MALGLSVDVVPAGGPLALAERVLAAVEAAPSSLVLAGDQAAIKVVRAHLKAASVHPTTSKVKAYWAEGRTGLD